MRFAAILLPLALFAAGCPADAEDVAPPQDELYFPTGMALSPDESHLFVNNANADLRFATGSLQVIDVGVIETMVRQWVDDRRVPDACNQDLDRRETVICPEDIAIASDETVRIGNFAGEIRVQALDDGLLRLFMPVRGDPSLTWVDFDPATASFDCGAADDVAYPQCDNAHRLTRLLGDPENLPMSTEPFGIYVDPMGYVMVTHLSTGNLTLASAPPSGAAPVLTDVKGGFFDPNRVTGIRGAVGIAGRQPGSPSNLVYVTSRSESRVQTVYAASPGAGAPLSIVPSDWFFLNTVLPAEESRGITFNPSGTRVLVINRQPPSLIVVDTSLGDTGRPKNEVAAVAEVCQQASIVEIADPGLGERAYVSCFRDGQVWVLDPVTASLEAVINVGRGPHSLAVSPSRNLLFVTNVLEDTIAVIDLRPGARTENRVVLRLGVPSFKEDDN